ncbi:hypothetical protein BGX29_007059 [Mortierella sp. GBA35]|nr:hypothetical protein BGX29_007059 [Mortierella sp. GBA35]
MGIPVFLDDFQEDEITPSALATGCQIMMSEGSPVPPALPPRHPHRRLAPQYYSTRERQLTYLHHYRLHQELQQQRQPQYRWREAEPQALHRQHFQRHADPTNGRMAMSQIYPTVSHNVSHQQQQQQQSQRPGALFSYYSQQQQLAQQQTQQRPQTRQQPQPQTHRTPSLHELMFRMMTPQASSSRFEPTAVTSTTATTTAATTGGAMSSEHNSSSSPSSSRGFSPDNRNGHTSNNFDSEDEEEEEIDRKRESLMDLEEQRRIEFERQIILYERHQLRRQVQLELEFWQRQREENERFQ